MGGMLPGAKVTPEIAAIRGIPVGVDCKSPSAHTAFSDVDSLLDLVESIADATGLPVGIKSAVGEDAFWEDLATRMAVTGPGRRLHHHRRGRGGHGRRPARLQRPRGPALQVGLPPRVPPRSPRPGCHDRSCSSARQARHPRERAARHGARVRSGERGPNGHVRHRLRAGPAVPHRPTAPRASPPSRRGCSAASTHRQVGAGAPTTWPPLRFELDVGSGAGGSSLDVTSGVTLADLFDYQPGLPT
jgi:hypothetical protein